MRLCSLLAGLLLAASAARADDAALLDRLVAAYPDALAGHDGTVLLWRDGSRMQTDDGAPGKTGAEAIAHGSILDMLRTPYPVGATAPPDADPGRVRNRAFFDKLYGDCAKGEVEPHLVPVPWLAGSWGHEVTMTSLHGVAAALAEVSRALDVLPESEKRFLYPPGGGYLCRAVRSTGQPSMHARGAAVDINVGLSDFWSWQRGDPPAYRNRVPLDIVDIFERHGFIWGGRWAHFDTMHFEYRPELLPSTTHGASASHADTDRTPLAR